MDYFQNLFESLTSTVGSFLPGVFGALLVLLIGFFIAGLVKKLVKKLLSKTNIDDQLAAKMGTGIRIDSFVAKLFYYLVVIYTLIIVLNMLGITSVLTPLQDMLTEFMGFIPNIIAAGIIGFAGYMIAKLVSQATGMISGKLESWGNKAGFDSGSIDLPKIIKQLVFVIILIPFLIIALDALNMKAISEPATEMLSSFLHAIPQILSAAILLAVFYIAGKYIVSILVNLFQSFGVDNFPKQMGLENVLGGASLSKMIGNTLLFFIIFTGLIAAADKLDMGQVQVILRDIFDIAGRVFFGLIIMVGGVLVSNLATAALSKSADNKWLVSITKFAIIGIFLAFALHTMGIADSIVNLAFGLTLGAIAVAFALSFGLGGREAAGKQMEAFFEKMKNRG